MKRPRDAVRWTAWLVVCLTSAGGPWTVGSEDSTAGSSAVVEYLTTWKIDRASRAVLESPAAPDGARLDKVLVVLAGLGRIPAPRAVSWQADAVEAGSLPKGERVQDRLVRVAGRALAVRPLPLSAVQAEVAGRSRLEVVRIATADGLEVDVIAEHVPRAWPRGRPCDEPASAVGLPLVEGACPGIEATDPPVAAGLVLAATRVAWHPPTPLGGLGMDYGLFDAVADGRRLVPGDTEAFYAALAAVGTAAPDDIAAACGPPGDVVPLIDPAQKWFASHRGEPFTVEGIARRATRIEIDEPWRRARLGTDHYWELFVFVDTSLIEINGRLQADYPVVCCVRTLPGGMPTGPRIGERVRVSGFAFKRYGYPLPDVRITSPQGDQERKGLRQETALIIGRRAEWLPRPVPPRGFDALGWALLGLAAVVTAGVALAAWVSTRGGRRRRWPDRIDL